MTSLLNVPDFDSAVTQKLASLVNDQLDNDYKITLQFIDYVANTQIDFSVHIYSNLTSDQKGNLLGGIAQDYVDYIRNPRRTGSLQNSFQRLLIDDILIFTTGD